MFTIIILLLILKLQNEYSSIIILIIISKFELGFLCFKQAIINYPNILLTSVLKPVLMDDKIPGSRSGGGRKCADCTGL